MKNKRYYEFAGALLCLLFGGIVVGTQVYHLLFQTQQTIPSSVSRAIDMLTPTATPSRKLVRLIIPSIGVNAPVESVGVTPAGFLDVPTQNPWEGVGWYQDGPYPGDRGSAVIDGHLDRPGGSPAVFWNLHNLQVGDSVIVVDSTGKILRFRVVALGKYPPEDAPISKIFSNNSDSFLNLITCAGQWLPSQHQTSLRLVVYTVLD